MYTKYLSPFVILAACGLLLLLTYPYLTPIGLAAVATVLVSPPYKWLRSKLPKLPTSLVAGACVLAFFLLVLTPLSFIIAKALINLGAFFSQLSGEKMSEVGPKKIDEIFVEIESFLANVGSYVGYQIHFEPLIWLKGALSKFGTWLVQNITTILGGAPIVLLDLFIFILAMFYFLIEGKTLFQKFSANMALPSAKVERLQVAFKSACRSIVFTNIITGAIQSLIVVIGAAVTGFKDLLLIGTLTFLCSFIPVIGAAPIAFVLAIIEFSQGDIGGGITLVVTGLLSGSTDNVIRPYLLSGSSTLHPLLSFLSIVGGISLMGLPGLFLGPILMQLCLALIEVYR